MYNEVSEESPNIHLNIIRECLMTVDNIRDKVSIITDSGKIDSIKLTNETPDRSKLESELKILLRKLQSLKNDIIV